MGQSLASSRWNNSIEGQVIVDLQQVVERTGPIDAVFFTGDLTQKGERTEFEEFENIRSQILRGLPQEASPVFLAVPGNHDLVRPAPESAVVRALRDWSSDPGLRRQFWSDRESDYRQAVRDAFSNWSHWAEQHLDWNQCAALSRDAVLPGDFAATLERDDIRIGVLGLNSAALQLTGEDYRRQLCLDGSQVSALVDRLGEWVEDHDACLLLTHHDPSWLDEAGLEALYGEIATPGRFVAHLCGHRHEQGRTLESKGGAEPRRTIIGRSLFGLDWYGDRVERRHGYSVGTVELEEESRTLRIWPRWDVNHQSGSVQIKADQSENLVDGWSTEAEELGPSPRPKEPASGRSLGVEVAPPGWIRVDADFLEARGAECTPDLLAAYFDGEDPEWAQIASGAVPALSASDAIVQDLQNRRSSQVSVHLVLGPGGEGKSTAVMQAAVAMALAPDTCVLWRGATESGEVGRLDWRKLHTAIGDGQALFLFIDDAHEVRSQLEAFLRPGRVAGNVGEAAGASIHLVLCAHEDEWAISKPRRAERWHRASNVSTLDVGGLNSTDAKLVVAAYRSSDALGQLDAGQDDDSLALELARKAQARASTVGEAALLGCLLEARTGESLEIHVERILQRAVTLTNESGLAVFPLFATAAAGNALGLPRLNLGVLEFALGIDAAELLGAVTVAGAELRVDGLGDNRAVRVRHSSIARSAAALAFNSSPASPIFASEDEVHRSLGRGAVAIDEFWRSPWSQPIVDLTVSARESNASAAVAIAEGLVEGDPANSHLRSRLAQTYREVPGIGDPAAAAATISAFLRQYPHQVAEVEIRPLLSEWAVCSGQCSDLVDRGARNAWLALWSFSDQVGGDLPIAHARHLPTVTRGLSLVGRGLPEGLVERVAAVVAVAGKRVSGTPHLSAVAKLAGDMLGQVGVDLLDDTLSEASRATWTGMSIDFQNHPALPDVGDLTFTALKKLVVT